MQQDRESDPEVSDGVASDAAGRLSPREQTELEEIELLAELMILANRASAKAPDYEIDQALGLGGQLERRNAS